MKITEKDTVKDVVIRNAALFRLGSAKIAKAMEDIKSIGTVRMKRRFGFDRRLAVKDVGAITMGELNAIESRKDSYEYFCVVLGIMLELVKHHATLPDGRPDWTAGFSIDNEAIGRLRFIDAMRCFIDTQKGIEAISKRWKSLEMPLTANEIKARVKRPNRGLVAVCRQYCQMMNGAVRKDDVWCTPWAEVYEAFESLRNDNLEQRRLHEIMTPKIRRK